MSPALQSHRTLFSGLAVAIRKVTLSSAMGDDTAVGNGNAMGITAQIVHHRFRPGSRL